MNDNKIIRRIGLTDNNGNKFILSFIDNNGKYSIQFSSTVKSITDEIHRIIERALKEHGPNEKNLDRLYQIIEKELISKNYKIDNLPDGDMTLNISIDTKTGEQLSENKKLHNYVNDSLDIENIALKMHQSIKDMFANKTIELSKNINAEIENYNYKKAYDLLKEAKDNGIFFFKVNMELFNSISLIKYENLQHDEIKELLLIKFIIAEKLCLFNTIENDVKYFINNFQDEIELELLLNIKLLRANAAAQNNKKELAFLMYNDIVKNDAADNKLKSWAYRGLSLLCDDNDPELIKNEKIAIDRFLETGNRYEAARGFYGLSKILQFKEPNNAIKYINEAILLLNDEELLGKDFLAKLYHHKAELLFRHKNYKEASESINNSIALRKNIIGIEDRYLSSLKVAEIINENISIDVNTKSELQSEINRVKNLIMDEQYQLKEDLAIILKSKNTEKLRIIEDRILTLKDDQLHFTFNIINGLYNTEQSIEKRIDCLENALKLADKSKQTENKILVFSAFANLYTDLKDDSKAMEWYRKILKLDYFNYSARQNYSALLWKNNLWDEAVIFFKNQREKFGDLPNILYAYGRSLFEAGYPDDALEPLLLAFEKDNSVDYVNEYLQKAISRAKNPNIDFIKKGIKKEIIITKDEFEQCLDEFIKFIKNTKRMSFWKSEKNISNKYSWKSKPEEIATNYFVTFMKGFFNDNIEILPEIEYGAGRADLTLKFSGNFKTIVELKICGSGYSKNYAYDGVVQLLHYMDNSKIFIGYLIIFDGRLNDFGKGFNDIEIHNNMTIYTRAIDVRNKVK